MYIAHKHAHIYYIHIFKYIYICIYPKTIATAPLQSIFLQDHDWCSFSEGGLSKLSTCVQIINAPSM